MAKNLLVHYFWISFDNYMKLSLLIIDLTKPKYILILNLFRLLIKNSYVRCVTPAGRHPYEAAIWLWCCDMHMGGAGRGPSRRPPRPVHQDAKPASCDVKFWADERLLWSHSIVSRSPDDLRSWSHEAIRLAVISPSPLSLHGVFI